MIWWWQANARKAIAPTQFNHQSTRGHCIMTFQVDRPNPDNPDFKYQGRLYVCDLAGEQQQPPASQPPTSSPRQTASDPGPTESTAG